MPRFLDWYLYVPSRSCPLFREKGGTTGLLIHWGGEGGGLLGLPQDWPTHTPTQADPPTQTPPYSPSTGGGVFDPASYVHCILKILTKGQGPKVQICKNQGLNPNLHIYSSIVHWTGPPTVTAAHCSSTV